jgi:two-component system chemotaxis response regulator CheY
MSKTIMTVDDSASMRQMISFTLTQAGHKVIEACDGRDALTKLGGVVPDMVITDLNMPNMDGIELIRQARTLPTLKKQAGKAAGATGWIVKPFKAEQLTGVVSKLLR